MANTCVTLDCRFICVAPLRSLYFFSLILSLHSSSTPWLPPCKYHDQLLICDQPWFGDSSANWSHMRSNLLQGVKWTLYFERQILSELSTHCIIFLSPRLSSTLSAYMHAQMSLMVGFGLELSVVRRKFWSTWFTECFQWYWISVTIIQNIGSRQHGDETTRRLKLYLIDPERV